MVTQAPALSTLVGAILSRKAKWNSPVLRWCMENVVINTDPVGHRKIDKGRNRDPIDGASACLKATQRASMGDLAGTFYDRPMADNPAFWSY